MTNIILLALGVLLLFAAIQRNWRDIDDLKDSNDWLREETILMRSSVRELQERLRATEARLEVLDREVRTGLADKQAILAELRELHEGQARQ